MDAQWLQEQFSLHPEKSKSVLADMLGLQPPTISKILGGARQIKPHEYRDMCAYFDLPTEICGALTDMDTEKGLRIFEVSDDMMQPSFKKGDQVLVNIKLNNPREPEIYLLSDGLSYMVRQCSPASKANPERIRISANDDDFQSQVLYANEFEVVGRVITKFNPEDIGSA